MQHINNPKIPDQDEWISEDGYDALNHKTFGLNGRFNIELPTSVSQPQPQQVMDKLDNNDEGKPIGRRTNKFNRYFMPGQVENKHLECFVDHELPGSSSLLESSVWSMHTTSTPSEVVPAMNHRPTFGGSQLHSDSINAQITLLTRSSPSEKEEVKKKKLTDAGVLELDRKSVNLNTLIGAAKNSVASLQSLNLANQKPVFKTVEEIERELFDENSATQYPPIEPFFKSSGSRPKVMTVEELERELMQASIPHRNASDVEPMQNIQRHPSPRHPCYSVDSTTTAQQPVKSSMTPPFCSHAFVNPVWRYPPGLCTPSGINMNLNMNPMMIQHQITAHANTGRSLNASALPMVKESSQTGFIYLPCPPYAIPSKWHHYICRTCDRFYKTENGFNNHKCSPKPKSRKN